MADRRRLAAYAGEALAAGRTRSEIRAALRDAGWPQAEVERALASWAETDFLPPVPAPQPFASARDGFLYALTFFALGAMVVNAISLAFTLIDAGLGADRLSPRAVAWPAAALVVFAPVFVLLDRRGRGQERDNPVRKVFAYATLFFASLVLLLTAVTVLGLLLVGGLGLAIVAKAAVVAAVAAAIWAYYRGDLTSDRS